MAIKQQMNPNVIKYYGLYGIFILFFYFYAKENCFYLLNILKALNTNSKNFIKL